MSLKDGEESGTVPHGVTSGEQQRADLLELTLKGFLQHSSIFSSIIRGSHVIWGWEIQVEGKKNMALRGVRGMFQAAF